MSGDPLMVFDILTGVVVLLIFGYTTYISTNIGWSLAVGLYRRQALWVSVLSAIYALLLLETFISVFYLSTESAPEDLIVSLSQDIGIIAIFAWADASARIARRSDPLLRDSLNWSKLRRFVWALLAVSIASTYYFAFALVASTGSLSVAPSPGLLISLAAFLFTPFVAGAFVIPVSAARTGDPVLRRHLRWFSLLFVLLVALSAYVVYVLAFGGASGYIDILRRIVENPASNTYLMLTYLVAGYAFFKSARSLVPLNKVSPEQ
ncbi:MAG TPA: hypothetical protein VEC08_04790 [Nitrososphaerales archaeon]|nr:hypothetical protein [Nitrososphaerales archaeon]